MVFRLLILDSEEYGVALAALVVVLVRPDHHRICLVPHLSEGVVGACVLNSRIERAERVALY